MLRKLVVLVTAALFVFGLSDVSQAATVRAAGATIVQTIVDELAKPFEAKNPGITIETAGGGSSVGIISAAEGVVEIGMSARTLTATEARMNPNVKLFPIAKDGIAIVVHPSNLVMGLTSAQVRDIFAGKITDWGAVGGKGPLSVVIRESGSGTRVAFEEALMGKEEVTGRARIGRSTGEVRRLVSGDPTAIGYVVIGAVDASLKALALDDKSPTADNVKAGIYPITASFFLVTDGEPEGATKTFIDFILSPEGQAIVARERLVPVRPIK